MESLEPAPTEEGYYLGGQIEKVLSELQEDKEVSAPRRYSRSFSEPNLFLRAMQASFAVSLEHPLLPSSMNHTPTQTSVQPHLSDMTLADPLQAMQEEQEKAEVAADEPVSDEEGDSGILTRLQSTLTAAQVRHACSSVLLELAWSCQR